MILASALKLELVLFFGGGLFGFDATESEGVPFSQKVMGSRIIFWIGTLDIEWIVVDVAVYSDKNDRKSPKLTTSLERTLVVWFGHYAW